MSVCMCVMAKYFCTFNSIFRKRGISECINLMQLIFVANCVCADSVDILATAFTLFRIYPIFCFCSTMFAQSTECILQSGSVLFPSVALDYCIHIHNCVAAATAFNTNLLLQ